MSFNFLSSTTLKLKSIDVVYQEFSLNENSSRAIRIQKNTSQYINYTYIYYLINNIENNILLINNISSCYRTIFRENMISLAF